MDSFITYSGYKVGASHIAKNLSCEDYAAAYDGEKVCIAVISDGHGDTKCFRSAQGARIACEVSIECVKNLIETAPNSCEVIKKSPDRIITELEKQIIREWNNGVNNDLNNNPISENELEGLPEDAIDSIRSRKSLNKIYGCTLIMCAVIEDFWFGIHIGDGKCVAAMNNGLYTQPIPWDEIGCVGNRATSICNSNSYAGFRYIYGTDIPTGLFVASDGIDESFDENGLNRCYYTLGYWVQTLEKEELDSKMEELLYQITNNGSGDDVSIACILSKNNEIKKPYASSEQVAEKLKELINQIKDKENRFESLSESKKEASDSLERIKAEIEELKKKIALQEEKVKDKEQEIKNIDINLLDITLQLQQSMTQLTKAKETKERIDQYWMGNGVDINKDTSLDYTPKYSDAFFEKIIAEIDGQHTDVQLVTENRDIQEEIFTTDSNNNLINENDCEINKNTIQEAEIETEKTDEITFARDFETEFHEESEEKENNQVSDIIIKSSEDSDIKSHKSGILGGIFGRKK